MECPDCNFYPCICESQNVRKEMLAVLLDLMNEKLVSYQEL